MQVKMVYGRFAVLFANVLRRFAYVLGKRTMYIRVYRTFSSHSWENEVYTCAALASLLKQNDIRRYLSKRDVSETTHRRKELTK